MLWQRALIALTLGPLALYLVYLGEWYYFLPITAIIILATYEFGQMMQRMGLHISLWILIPAVVLQLLNGQWPEYQLFGVLFLVSLLVMLAYVLWLYERRLSDTAPMDWMAMMGGLVLLGWVGSHFLRLRGVETFAWQWTILALVSTWAADSGAYLVGKFMAGRILGRHQLSPRLSPNKTVEGYIGGIVLGTAITLTFAYFLKLPWLPSLVLGLLASIVSPLGDLGISLLKREAKIKDSGTVFGVHGGALDRIDSVLWSVTMAYYLVLFIS
ncbi:MAG: phosphatidate cytidylyltransferase [Ardenticatenaceae bacterium]|nr:phosphatidate cytidylyltransferase [Ardenticatenaceae bacterium]